jgi:hypothetical protein
LNDDLCALSRKSGNNTIDKKELAKKIDILLKPKEEELF